MTEPEATSRRYRFPWAQLVFCLACLGMAAWTWMRYSYAWPTGVREAGTVTSLDAALRLEDRYASMSGHVEPALGPTEGLLCDGRGRTRHMVRVGGCEAPLPSDSRVHHFKGRLSFHESNGGLAYHGYLYVGGGCLTGASIAGLVVGAMGVFIFGLYLRRWLGDRKALRVHQQRI
ncbi:MAG: hypothetical protein ACYS9X_10920 [Planctomycetota bacterium]|jgi:hypothetical protein